VRSLTLRVLSDAWKAGALAQTSDACVLEPTQGTLAVNKARLSDDAHACTPPPK
jgi:hypothetical protein